MNNTLNTLIRIMQESEMSQRDLANKLKVSEACISRWMHRNRPNMSIESIEKIVDALGYEVCILPKGEVNKCN